MSEPSYVDKCYSLKQIYQTRYENERNNDAILRMGLAKRWKAMEQT